MSKNETSRAYVEQQPVGVSVACPYCDHTTHYDYDDFCLEHGDPPDWDGEPVTCEHCNRTFEIDGQEWD